MVNLSSTVLLFTVLHFTSAAPQHGRNSFTPYVSSSTASFNAATVSEMADAENTIIMNGFRSRRKGKHSLYPPISSSTVIASPSAASPLLESRIVIPGTTEEERRYSFQASHSILTVVARATNSISPDDLTPLLMPLPDIIDPSGKTTIQATKTTNKSTSEDLTPLLMPLPDIVQPSDKTTTLAASSTNTGTREDLTSLLMSLPDIVQPCNKTASPTTSPTTTSTPKDLTPLLMPLPDIINPSDETTSLAASSTSTSDELTPLLMPLPNIFQPRSLRQWFADKLGWLTGKDPEELKSAIEGMGSDGFVET